MPTVFNQSRNRPGLSGVFAPQLPNMTGSQAAAPTGGAGLDRANIDSLLRGEFDPYEINMESAERAIGSGTGGSGFAQAGRYKLLDSEKLARKRMGNEMLDPYLNREHQAALQKESLAAQAELAKSEAQWAMERLQASEAGLSARLSAQEKAELERLILRGEQAMDLERLNQEGQQANTALSGAFNLMGRLGGGGGGSGGPASRYNADKYGGQSFRYTTNTFGDVTSGAKPPPDYWTPSGGSDSNVQNLIGDILKKYGFSGLKF